MATKPKRHVEYREIVYDAERWSLLKDFRQKAMQLMEALENFHLKSVVHGSIARGDVNKKSDVDVFIPSQVSSFTVETALEKAGILVNRRMVVQATPTYAMKAYIEIDENTSVSFPLMKMRTVEREFYKFGGEASIENLRDNMRVCGVDKRLMLIEPTKEGHRESTIIGREEQIAKLLGISVETVLDRVHALLRRDEVGRTGVFVEKELSSDETFEMALKRLADQNPAVRRRMKTV
ncbi:MAG: nucleotidyltransferase domain-containing protein [Candidatus Bathyarchaeota archaeon]|nr:DNA polymerase subunit beta [Candidatus Bathyarchaeota archaeon A05DMB-5]MDH7557767.1 nucleotidyltransferase domain-containing protein [Candidatus Bathyarchaeota archaeon]